MENHFPSEVTHVEHHENKNEVRNVTIVLTVLTLIELALGFWMMKMDAHSTARFATKITIIVLMLAKAYYIVGYFMHLKHEIRNMIMTIVVPLALFIWFIIAFLYDGNSFRNLRNNYDPHFKAQQEVKAKPMEHNKAGHESEGHKEGGHEESKEVK
jgi:cytochrome c oxidase subunit IV